MESPPLLNPTSIINLNLSFKNLPNIEEIKQYKNLVWFHILYYLSSKIELDLSGNNFKDPEESLKALAMFPFLKKINLAYNNLNFTPLIPRNIETLILNHNSLFALNENLLQTPRLCTLDLSNNFIVDVSILQKITTLKYLFLKNNKVKQLCFWDFYIKR